MLFAQKERLRIIDWIKQAIMSAAEKDMCIDKNRMIAEITIKFGSTRKKAEEYIRDLLFSQFINEVAGTLALNKLPEKTIQEEFNSEFDAKPAN